MLRARLRNRRLTISLAILLASMAALAVGLFAIVTALIGGVDLPNEGSLEDVVGGSRDLEYEDLPSLAQTEPGAALGPPPIQMVIERIQVDAAVVTLALDSEAIPQVPDGPEKVAYYDFSPRPGQGGNAVFSGHVDWISRGRGIPAVFFRLKELQRGDLIRVYLEDGTELRYLVTANVGVQYTDPNVLKVMDRTDKDVITLITCGGSWLPDRRARYGGNYSHRVIVRAERVLVSAGSQAF